MNKHDHFHGKIKLCELKLLDITLFVQKNRVWDNYFDSFNRGGPHLDKFSLLR